MAKTMYEAGRAAAAAWHELKTAALTAAVERLNKVLERVLKWLT